MSGSVIYNTEMWMDEDASSPSGSNWHCQFLHTSFVSKNSQFIKARDSILTDTWINQNLTYENGKS